MHVVADAKPRCRRASIPDGECEFLSGFRQRRQHQVQAIVGVRENQVVGRWAGNVELAAAPHRLHGHAAGHRHRCQVEIEIGDRVAHELDRDRRLAGNRTRLIVQPEPEDVVQDIHAGLPRISVRVERRIRDDGEQGRYCQSAHA